MGGVDTVDQELKYYSPRRITDRWTFKLTVYLLQTIIFKSYVLYQQNTLPIKSNWNIVIISYGQLIGFVSGSFVKIH